MQFPTRQTLCWEGYCEQGQQGPVWFLAGVFGTAGGTAKRSCTVPIGKYILFPILTNTWIQTPQDDIDHPDCKGNETCWREFAKNGPPPLNGSELEATLDGKPIIFNPNTPIIRSQSPVFTASFPPDNVFGANLSHLTGCPIVSDGFWVMLPPLSPGDHNGSALGDHTLHFRAGSNQDVTYHLTVGKRSTLILQARRGRRRCAVAYCTCGGRIKVNPVDMILCSGRPLHGYCGGDERVYCVLRT